MINAIKTLSVVLTGTLAFASYFSIAGQAKTSIFREPHAPHSLFASKEGDALRSKIVAIGQQSSCAGVVFKCDSFAEFVKVEMIKQKIPGKYLRIETGSTSSFNGNIFHIPTNQLIANNGFHDAIIATIDGQSITFDNITPKGVDLATWKKSFDSPILAAGKAFKETYTSF
jgi:hypothetical protein